MPYSLSIVKSALSLLAFLVISPPAEAKTFANQFVEFEIPQGWDCSLEGIEWVCRALDPAKSGAGMIKASAALTEKAVLRSGASFDQRLVYSDAKGQEITQALGWKLKSSRPISIAATTWIDKVYTKDDDSKQYGRFLRTSVEDIDILISFLVPKADLEAFRPQMEKAIKSLRGFRKVAHCGPEGDADLGSPGIFQEPPNPPPSWWEFWKR